MKLLAGQNLICIIRIMLCCMWTRTFAMFLWSSTAIKFLEVPRGICLMQRNIFWFFLLGPTAANLQFFWWREEILLFHISMSFLMHIALWNSRIHPKVNKRLFACFLCAFRNRWLCGFSPRGYISIFSLTSCVDAIWCKIMLRSTATAEYLFSSSILPPQNLAGYVDGCKE